jgi:transcriptional regulator with XRE-family HTH domain
LLRLTFERIARGVSQDAVADAVCIPQSTVSLIERGRINPTPRELQRLAEVFDVPADRLLERVDVEAKP